MKNDDNESASPRGNFIRDIIDEDLRKGTYGSRVATRFPPEPNGYLHIGHAKAIVLNFEIAKDYGGTCNLRFDDTNPLTEQAEFVESIKEDIRWLGYDWEDRLYFASDYFEQLYQWAVQLIKEGKAYVDNLSDEQIKEYRGNYYTPGKESPQRNRSVEENLSLFRRMREGEFADGQYVLRAKIDMNASNMNMRDPLMYRIKHASHHRTGNKWCIYPMYDWAHGQSDAIERITHSLCTLEFQDHRPLYDWFVQALHIPSPPKQIEFARLNLTYTVLSKRFLSELVNRGYVEGWDDPRMPTICGLRRRGYPPGAIRNFCRKIGISKVERNIDIELLEEEVRQYLNETAKRYMAVLKPLKVVIENFPADKDSIELDAPYLPEDFSMGGRKIYLTREIFVEQDDFRDPPPKRWRRLAPGREVRLRYGCLITCKDVIKDPRTGQVIELRCVMDPDSIGGVSPDGRKVRGTLHWVSADHSFNAQVRLYERLFKTPNPMDLKEGETIFDKLNPGSLEILDDCRLEPALADVEPGDMMQFERIGYFCVDTKHSKPGKPVFNRSVTLRDTWAKIEKKLNS